MSRAGIYIASKSKHAPRWRALRDRGVPIVSTWIDEADEGATTDWADLWDRCIREASTASAVIVYHEEGEVQKGGLVELGAALHAGVPVYWIGPEYSTAPRHRLVRNVPSVPHALVVISTLHALNPAVDDLPERWSAVIQAYEATGATSPSELHLAAYGHRNARVIAQGMLDSLRRTDCSCGAPTPCGGEATARTPAETKLAAALDRLLAVLP